MKDNSRIRHLAKTITYRILATISTVILAWVISGDPLVGVSIGGWDFFIKMTLYYFHERAWYKFNLGLDKNLRKSQQNDE